MNVPLQLTVSHPHSLAFVVKLHRDCEHAAHPLCGRVEHVASGERGVFDGLSELQSWIGHVIARQVIPDSKP
jgi:hypothetical protein